MSLGRPLAAEFLEIFKFVPVFLPQGFLYYFAVGSLRNFIRLKAISMRNNIADNIVVRKI